MNDSLIDGLRKRLQETNDDAPACIDAHGELTLAGLLERSEGLGRLIALHGAGQNVGILLPNSCDFMLAFYAIQFAERTAVPLNPFWASREFEYIFSDAGIQFVLTSRAMLEACSPALSAVEMKPRFVCIDDPAECIPETDGAPEPAIAEGAAASAASSQRLAVILYTSGTTGRPKGVMLTQRNLISNALASGRGLDITAADRAYCVLPLFHSFALTMANMSLLNGAAVVFESSFKPSSLIEALERRKITFLFMTPAHYNILLRTGRMTPELWAGLRVVLSGGGALSVATQTRWLELTGKELLNGYGLTEASPVIALNRPGFLREGSIGQPLDNVEAQIHGPGNEAILPRGQVGELYARGPNIMRGYLNQPDETLGALTVKGWLRTGDLGYMDHDGYIFITGRKKELIIFAGENIMPQEIEHALLEHEAIAEAAVVGIPDERHGEWPKAFLVVRQEYPPPEPRELREFLRPRIASFKIPREFEYITAMPRNTLGKLLKHKLIEGEFEPAGHHK